MTKFQEKICKIVKKIPRGKVSTYARVARAAGSPGAARAVGNAMKKNDRPYYKVGSKGIPCHRVVKSDGSLGGFSGGLKRKIELLEREGVEIRGSKIADFKRILVI